MNAFHYWDMDGLDVVFGKNGFKALPLN